MENTSLTLVHRIQDWAQEKPHVPALYERGGDELWQALTWKEYWEAVREVAKGLIALGHEAGECVAIVGNNRVDWVLCQFGMMAARGVPAPIYTTNTVEQTAYIVDHCRAKIAICDNKHQLEKVLAASEQGLISVDSIITMDELDADDEGVMSLKALREKGRQEDDTELDKRIDALTDTETSLLIYTSGTTGVPKAVQLNHGGMIAVAESIRERFGDFVNHHPYRLVSYLPLCHVAEQLFTNMLAIGVGGEVYFCPDLKAIRDYLVHVRPTIFLGVPRVWEKFQAALEARLGEAKGIKAALANWARKTELACFRQEVAQGKPVMTFSRKLAHKLVISKVKDRLGLDQLKVAVTGAAPISMGTLEFFASLGLTVYEGYGMSETSAVATSASYGAPRFGTVGKPLRCCQVKIADDGEILLKGRNMTTGYLHMPEKTRELLSEDGWLHTGDLGSLDEEGNLRITGRKKDILITAGGKNVAPAEMEAYMKQIPGVGQAVVVGDRQPYLCALLTLDVEALEDLRALAGAPGASLAELAESEKLRTHLEKEVEQECNAKVARYQTIKKIKVLPVEFSVESDELTPTMKIKRNVVHDKYKNEIASLYN